MIDNNITINDNYEIYEDEYEESNSELINQIAKFEVSNSNIESLITKNEEKMNKLKLLLYQKFLNILFSILTLRLRKIFRLLEQSKNIKYLEKKGYVTNNKKYKLPSFYVQSLNKQKERQEKLKFFQNK